MAGRFRSAMTVAMESILCFEITEIVPLFQLVEKADASAMAGWDLVLSIISEISVAKFLSTAVVSTGSAIRATVPDKMENAKMQINNLDIKTGLDFII
jgi:hypothetical protein